MATKKENWYIALYDYTGENQVRLDSCLFGPYPSKDAAIEQWLCDDPDFDVNEVIVFKDAEIVTLTAKRTIEKKSRKV